MDNRQFAIVSHALTSLPSRRHVLHGLAGLGLAAGASWLPEAAMAKKKKRNKKKTTLCLDGQTIQASSKKKKQLLKGGAMPGACAAPPPPPGVPNEFGCLSVDVRCTSAAECCTGVCEVGLCRGHDAGTCDQNAAGVCALENGEAARCNNSPTCLCLETTGGSKVCGQLGNPVCTDCRKDADCLALGFPAGSSCAPVNTGLCVGTCESGMICVTPCGTEPPPELIAPRDSILAGKRKRR